MIFWENPFAKRVIPQAPFPKKLLNDFLTPMDKTIKLKNVMVKKCGWETVLRNKRCYSK